MAEAGSADRARLETFYVEIIMRLKHPLFSVVLAIFAGCDDGITDRRALTAPQAPVASISDGAQGGNAKFFLLPPMFTAPSFSGEFDPRVSPIVRVCELANNSCARTVAEFRLGTGTEAIRLSTQEEHYITNWHTRRYGLDVDRMYRIVVSGADPEATQPDAPEMELGFVDVDLVSDSRSLQTVESGRYVGVVNGSTLPIKFRIEKGAFSTRFVLTDRLDPRIGALHVNPNDGVWATRPAGGSKVNQYIVDRGPDGAPRALVAVARVDLARDSVERYAEFNDAGLPSRIVIGSGATMELTYPGGTRMQLKFNSPDGKSYLGETALPVAIEEVRSVGEPATSGPRLASSAGPSGTAEIPFTAVVKVPVLARHAGQTAPVPSATVYGTYATLNDFGYATSLGIFRATSVEGAPEGEYSAVIAPNGIANVNDAINRGCQAWEAIVETRCNQLSVVRFSVVAAVICGIVAASAGPAAPAVAAACIEALTWTVAAICKGQEVCDGVTTILAKFFPPDARIQIRVQAWARGSTAEVKKEHVTPLTSPVTIPVEFGLLMWVAADPPGINYYSEDYEFAVNFLPKLAGLTVAMRAEGTDGWRRSDLFVPTKDGRATLTVLRPESFNTYDQLTAQAEFLTRELAIQRHR